MQFTTTFLLAALPFLAIAAPTPAGILDTVPFVGSLTHDVGSPPVTGSSGGGPIGNIISPLGQTLGSVEAGVKDLLTPESEKKGMPSAAPSVPAMLVPSVEPKAFVAKVVPSVSSSSISWPSVSPTSLPIIKHVAGHVAGAIPSVSSSSAAWSTPSAPALPVKAKVLVSAPVPSVSSSSFSWPSASPTALPFAGHVAGAIPSLSSSSISWPSESASAPPFKALVASVAPSVSSSSVAWPSASAPALPAKLLVKLPTV